MPMVAATSGTLSMTADARPMMPAIRSFEGTCSSRNTASPLSSPAASSEEMDMRMPRKKRMPCVSIRESALGTRRSPSLPSP